jgi:hypothetical protein
LRRVGRCDGVTGFHEAQRLRPRFRWLVAVLPALVTALAIEQIRLGHPVSPQSLSNGACVSLAILLWLVYVWLTRVTLVTDVDGSAVSIRLRGLARHHRIPIATIKTASVVQFHPNRDFGGQGMRAVAGGRAYVADTVRGVRLELEGDGFAVIGSTRPEQLLAAIADRRREHPTDGFRPGS